MMKNEGNVLARQPTEPGSYPALVKQTTVKEKSSVNLHELNKA